MNTKLIRQGDVVLKPVEKTEGRLVGKDKRVLKAGLSTGHSHTLVGKGLKFYKNAQKLTVLVPKAGATLTHEEHAHLKIKSGCYEVVEQREFDLMQGIRKAMD